MVVIMVDVAALSACDGTSLMVDYEKRVVAGLFGWGEEV